MSNRAKYWARLLDAWKKSGLTQAEFCRRRDVKAVTFAWWKRKLSGTADAGERRRHRSTARGRRTSAKFAEVVWPGRVVTTGAAESADRPAAGYEIMLADGLVIRSQRMPPIPAHRDRPLLRDCPQ